MILESTLKAAMEKRPDTVAFSITEAAAKVASCAVTHVGKNCPSKIKNEDQQKIHDSESNRGTLKVF